MKARRTTSLKLYETYTTKWKAFCLERQWDFIHATIPQGLLFLQSLVDSGVGYSVINTARSALSALLILPNGAQFGAQADVCLFLKGVFNIKPTQPRYVSTWDPSQVLKFLESWVPAHNISLEKLTLKVIMLILLLSGQRPQIITKLSLDRMKQGQDYFEFILELTDLKQGRVNYRPGTIRLQQYPSNKRLCIFNYMLEYVQRTALIRHGQNTLILTHKKPHRPATQNSIARWIKQLLTEAGIDTKTFSAGSTRSAATSKAHEQGAPIQQVMDMGGWTQMSTFTKFYNRPILPMSCAARILNSVDPE